MGRKQLRLDLHHLARQAAVRRLRRMERRQLRKRLGRKYGLEWRSFGNVKGGLAFDAMNDLIVRQAKTLGHVAQHRP